VFQLIKRRLCVARTLYNLLMCATLALLATLWLRPGLAQDLIDLARSVRAQSPGVAAASPQANDWNSQAPPSPGWGGQPGVVPYSNLPSGLTQPIPATRPVSWPGAPLEYATPSAATNGAAPVASPTNASGYGATMPGAVIPQGTLPPQTMPQTAGQPAAQYPSPYQAQPQISYVGMPQNSYAATPPTASPLPPGMNPVPAQTMPPAAAYVPAPMQTMPMGALGPSGPVPNGTIQATPGGVAMVPQPDANMQSLQVLPGPREEYADGKIVATVGNLPILAGDVRAMINQAIHNNMFSAPPPEHEKEFIEAAMRPVLKQMVEMKLVVNDAKQTIPAAGMAKIEVEVNHDFDKNRIPKLMEDYHVSNQHELDEALRKGGSSLDWERRSFFEQNIYHGWRDQQVKDDKQVALADVLGYYEQHLLDYEYPAQAKWEELMVSFDKFSDKNAAYAAIAQMGNQVMQGAPFTEVAMKMSQGPTADKGGAYDWTTQGSLACKALDENMFQLPIGSLSSIVESDRGFHIIRVVDRKVAGRKSFEDAQGDIKKQLKEENFKKQRDKYLAELHKKTPVHSVFDDQLGGLDGPPKEEDHHF
jgi:hypothetical protein